MRFGVCCSATDAELAAEAGYDYIELAAAADLRPDESEADWLPSSHVLESLPLVPEAFNSFVRTGKITGPEADFVRLERYVHTALVRASRVGGQVVVFGSGGARQIPDGWSVSSAVEQIGTFLDICHQASAATGVKVVIEPLCKLECNIINLVSEGAVLARQHGVLNLADTYHMEAEGEPLAAIVESGDCLGHVHTADTGRFAPGTGSYDHVAMFQALQEANYNLRLSIECGWQNRFSELVAPALHHIKKCYEAAAKS
jgi:sugar phosphate isomerase/epimerase